MKEIIDNLTRIGYRQGIHIHKAYEYLCDIFFKNNISFKTEIYEVDLPVWGKYSLRADKKEIPCLPTGFTSGKINSADVLTTSLISSKHFIGIPHINFNPKSNLISQANFSFAPSLAVSRKSLLQITKAQKIKGEISVIKKKQKTYQILVGNTKNPKNIIFSHFDSIGKGAVDNASGTALMIQALISQSDIIKDNLFVFDGNEEISYDYPVYWGRGYRNFEKKYSKQISQAKQLIIVDCIGYDTTTILSGKKDSKIIKLAFPIKNIDTFTSKIKLITSDYNKLMKVYHSDADVPALIKDKFMKQALEVLIRLF